VRQGTGPTNEDCFLLAVLGTGDLYQSMTWLSAAFERFLLCYILDLNIEVLVIFSIHVLADVPFVKSNVPLILA
jgi:hypothetical protein